MLSAARVGPKRQTRLIDVRAVIIGAGASGVLHALALRATGVRISAVYDPDPERADALAEACGARALASLASAGSADAEIAAVCSPPSAHAEQAEALACGGRIVLVEKPVATTRSTLERLRRLRCVPILQWRSGRALRAVRRAILHGELGPSPVVSCDLAWGRDEEYFRRRRAWGCGALLSVGIHALDAIGWALGRDIVSAAGLTTSARAEVVTETAAVVLLRFAGGAMASLRISLDGGGDSTRITMCGNGTTVQLAGGEADPTGGTLEWSTARARDRERLQALERDTPGALGSPLLVPYLGGVIAAIRDGEEPGESQRLPSIADSFAAHAAAMRVVGAA